MNGKIQYFEDVNAQMNIKFKIPIAFKNLTILF